MVFEREIGEYDFFVIIFYGMYSVKEDNKWSLIKIKIKVLRLFGRNMDKEF